MPQTFRLVVRRVQLDEITLDEICEAGRVMHRGVSPAPWNYSNWAVGDADSPPGPESAIGYIKLCDTFVFLEIEFPDGSYELVGVCAGMSLSDELTAAVHLHDGLDGEASARALPGRSALPVAESDFYHLIIAIDDRLRPDGLPLRGSLLEGRHAARLLLEMLMDEAWGRGHEAFWSKTHPEVVKMHHLFEAHGLAKVGFHVTSHGAASAPRNLFVGDLRALPRIPYGEIVIGDWIPVAESVSA